MPPTDQTQKPQTPQKTRLKGIGAVLTTRRTRFDPAHHRDRPGWMETVRSITNLSQTTVSHVETGARADYGEDTAAKVERLYELRPGTFLRALTGEGDLIAADGEVLYPPPPPGAEHTRERAIAREWHNEITSRAVGMALDLQARTEGLPDDEARAVVRRALDAAEAQGRLIMDTELRAWARSTSPQE
ncbi:hypothetical protein [Nocardiopsis tropica]|uniref:HTH cro/C1-type domain-containing protein n=2 Tax=Nocardiopsis tropica TaxID=109330 RepID=A0ABU7KZT5_9ACTN|nr:hypothetical protein [Nocardiopsis umidischolae]MEE2054783.1 hypothetical protein [Nocardiopsis umidischolae]